MWTDQSKNVTSPVLKLLYVVSYFSGAIPRHTGGGHQAEKLCETLDVSADPRGAWVMTSVVLVDTGGTVVEYVTADEDPQQVCSTSVFPLNILLSFLISIHIFWLPCPLPFLIRSFIPQQEGECEVDLDLEGEVEGECEAEEAYEDLQEREEAGDYPAVIVEEVPGAGLTEEQAYSAQVVVYDDEAYLMQEVGDEQEVETEGEAGET